MKTITMITSPDETTHERIIRNGNLETTYRVSDFVNPESFSNTPDRRMNKAYVVLNEGYPLAIVFSEYYSYCEEDALDAAVGAGKLDGLQVDATELADYQVGTDSEGNPEYEGISHLGNASEMFADESLDIWILPMSTFAEEPALMTLERVQARLEDWEYEADKVYQANVESDQWQVAYKTRKALRDARTLCRFAAAR